MEGIILLIVIAILIMSVVIHEVSHGYAALMLGDTTAKYAGRLTLNPIKHLDPIGSFLVPLVLYMTTNMAFGWAKPVPYNPYNLKDQKWGPGIVAAAGPASNIFVAFVFGSLFRIISGYGTPFSLALSDILIIIVFINLLLAVFNLVPIPPLDGSKVLFSLLPYKYIYIQEFLEQYGLFLLIIFIFVLFPVVKPLISILFSLFTGVELSF